MKKFISLGLLIVGSFVLLGNSIASPNSTTQKTSQSTNQLVEETATFTIENMTCNMCPITVRKAMGKVDGVIKATADYDTKIATVIFDPSITNKQAIADASTNAGYPATVSTQ